MLTAQPHKLCGIISIEQENIQRKREEMKSVLMLAFEWEATGKTYFDNARGRKGDEQKRLETMGAVYCGMAGALTRNHPTHEEIQKVLVHEIKEWCEVSERAGDVVHMAAEARIKALRNMLKDVTDE